MSKSEFTTTTRIIKFDTAVPFAEVIARLDIEVNKTGSGDMMKKLKRVTSQEELKNAVQNIVRTDFLYFSEIPHHKLLNFLDGQDTPGIVVYTIGNPLIAQTILPHNPLAAYSIPPRFLILEHRDRSGCSIVYHLPSSVMGTDDGNPRLQAALEALDSRVESLVAKITAE